MTKGTKDKITSTISPDNQTLTLTFKQPYYLRFNIADLCS